MNCRRWRFLKWRLFVQNLAEGEEIRKVIDDRNS